VAESVSSDSGTSDEGSKGDEEEEAARIPEIIVDPVEEREVNINFKIRNSYIVDIETNPSYRYFVNLQINLNLFRYTAW